MVQGSLKKGKGGVAVTKHHRKPAPPKRTAGAVKKNAKLQKKLKGQSVGEIERIMSSRAGATGKLTIMKKVGQGTPTTEKTKGKAKKGKAK